METIHLELPAALLQAADLDGHNVAQETARLPALELCQVEFAERLGPSCGIA